jgi:hypothetical protein
MANKMGETRYEKDNKDIQSYLRKREEVTGNLGLDKRRILKGSFEDSVGECGLDSVGSE